MKTNLRHTMNATVWAVHGRNYVAAKDLVWGDQEKVCACCLVSIPRVETWRLVVEVRRRATVNYRGEAMSIPGTMIDETFLGYICSEGCMEELVKQDAQPFLDAIIEEQRPLYAAWIARLPQNETPSARMLNEINRFVTFLSETNPEWLHTLRQLQYAEQRRKMKQKAEGKSNDDLSSLAAVCE